MSSSDSTDLTGMWEGDDGSVTYLRQVELGASTQIFWASLSSPYGYPFFNIFTGYRIGSNITGQWVDVPQANDNYIGTIILEVVSPTTIRQVANTLRYGTKIWTKVRNGFPAKCPANEYISAESKSATSSDFLQPPRRIDR